MHMSAMTSLSRSIYLSADVGVPTDVPPAGSSLENLYVYDSVARELKAMADEGLLQVVSEARRPGASESLIGRIRFARLR
jgi:hypothetical protein